MSYYDEMLQMANKAREKGRLVKRANEVQLENIEVRSNSGAWLASPTEGFNLTTMDLHMSRLGPGQNSRMHRHMNEAIIHIISGKGHSVIADERVDWGVGDTLVIPVFAWHQHFNDDKENPAVYVAATNLPLMERLNLAKIEDS